MDPGSLPSSPPDPRHTSEIKQHYAWKGKLEGEWEGGKELHLCSVSHPKENKSLRPWLKFGTFVSMHAVQMAG